MTTKLTLNPDGLSKEILIPDSTSGYGGSYDNATVDIVRQYIKTDQELIELFGIVSQSAITVDQSQVDYGIIGSYPVIFSFAEGLSFTLQVNIVSLFNFDLQDVKKYSTKAQILSDVFTKLNTLVDFSTPNLLLNGAPAPSNPSPDRYEWNGVDIELLKNVEVEFLNAFTLNDLSPVKMVINSIRESVYGVPEQFNQAVGFDFTGEQFKIVFKNFNELTFEMNFYNQTTGEPVELPQINALFKNVQAAKIAGTDYQEARVYVTEDTLLLADEKTHPATDIPVTLFSYQDYNVSLEMSEKVQVLMSKNNASTLLFTIGKEYTGLRTNQFTSLQWEEIGIEVRVGSTMANATVESVYRENVTPTTITAGNFSTRITIPAGVLKSGKKYSVTGNAKYTRSGGDANPSNVGFRVVQGITNKIDDLITVERDATASLSMNIPQIVGRLEFNSTQAVLIEAYVPIGEQTVTINSVKVRFTEVNEIEI